MEQTVLNALLEPGPAADQIAASAPEYKKLQSGKVPLDCILLKPEHVSEKANPADKAPTGYCLSQAPLLLRLVQQRYNMLVAYNRFAQLGTRYLPKEVVVSSGSQIRATLHVTSFMTAPTLKESDFALPPTMDTSGLDIEPSHLDSGVLSGALLNKVPPRYPEADKQDHLAGTVFLHALIGKTGQIEDLEVMSAPSKTMARASLDAVRQWRYKPYLLSGQPTTVDTIIVVNFSLSRL